MAPLPSLWLLACRAPHDVSHLPETAVPAPAADAGPLVRELASARIAAVGDLLMHGMVQRSATEAEAGFDALWADVTPRLLEADLAFANLETPIAPKNGKGVRPMVFNAPPTLLDSLVGSGFDVVSFANNHVYDQGRAGLTETVQILDEHPIAFVGAGTTCAEARAARLLDAGEIKVGFLGATDLYNDDLNAGEEEACTFTFDVETVVAEAAAARQAGAELVIVSVHWGVEYDTAPQQRHVEAAHALIEGGVDVVLGHHPHVLQPIEVVQASDGRLGLVVYSLGNFVSNQSAWYVPGLHKLAAGNPRDGLLVRFRAVRRQYGRGPKAVVRAELADLEAIPLWTLNNTQVGRAKDDPVVIRVVETARRIDALRVALEVTTDDADVVALTRELDELERRWEGVGELVGRHLLPAR